MTQRGVVGVWILGAAWAIACGGGTVPSDPASTSSSSSGGSSSTSSSSSGVVGTSSSSSSSGSPHLREPKVHRRVATPCPDGRSDAPSNAPDAGASPGGYIECHLHSECTAGKNGRCTGNPHDGWRCSYDECAVDAECGGQSLCECEGGFRSDNNVCLAQNGCHVDADCGPAGQGWCSPSLGSCGHYGKYESYQCHTPADECVDDADCVDAGPSSFGGQPYCTFDAAVGHWKCSTSECAG